VLVSRIGTLDQLPSGARVGTSSTARTLQLLAARPDLWPREIRGDVPSRLRQLDAGQYDAIVLAAAGLRRLGCEHRITEYLPLEVVLPAPGQGALGLTTRGNDGAALLARSLSHAETAITVAAERAFARRLAASGRLVGAAYATIDGSRIRLWGMAATSPARIVRRTVESDAWAALPTAEALADALNRAATIAA
jgi:hydroxymethylbilane synthase